jgi:hypothetical protein
LSFYSVENGEKPVIAAEIANLNRCRRLQMAPTARVTE